ncbi:hypothetical protein DFH09DRAFT_1080121 [Mycena vulgaris]|nr:hypothetical protein DFH09DRAFT_1080121 [Mycena vulgaris]
MQKIDTTGWRLRVVNELGYILAPFTGPGTAAFERSAASAVIDGGRNMEHHFFLHLQNLLLGLDELKKAEGSNLGHVVDGERFDGCSDKLSKRGLNPIVNAVSSRKLELEWRMESIPQQSKLGDGMRNAVFYAEEFRECQDEHEEFNSFWVDAGRIFPLVTG